MAAGEQDTSRVIIFEDSIDPIWGELAEEGAVNAGWESLLFDNPTEALRVFDPSINALVTALGKGNSLGSGFPATDLVNQSDRLQVPRAIYSAHPDAAVWTRKGTSDIVIPKIGTDDIPQAVANWLIGLTQAS